MSSLRAGLFSLADSLPRRYKRLLLLSVDAIVAPVALYVTFMLQYGALYPAMAVDRFSALFVMVATVTAVLSWTMGLPWIKLKAYESMAIMTTGVLSAIATVALAIACAVFNRYISGAGLMLFGLLQFMLLVGARFGMLLLLRWVMRQGKTRRRVIIYGAGKTGMQLAAALRAHDDIQAVAFVDDNPALHSMTVAGLRVHPSDRIDTIARDRDVERVLLAMPSLSAPKITQVMRRLQAQGLEVQALPSFAQLVGTEELVDNLTPVEPGKFLGRRQFADALVEGAAAYAGRTILVSGAGGSVGSELCRQLLRYRPKRLVLFEVSEIALYTIDRELTQLAETTGVEIVPVLGSVMDSRVSRSAMVDHSVEVVFHAAAYKHVPLVEANPIAGVANNILGTRTFADAAQEAGVKLFILISTDKAVRPTNVMGASKRLAELVIQDMAKRSPGTVFSMVRFGNVLGSSGSVVPLFKEQIARGGPVTVTHPDVTRFFMTIAEAAHLVLLAGSFAQSNGTQGGDVYVLDMGKPIKIRDLAEQMIQAAGYTVRDAANPDGDIEIQVTGLRPGEKLHEELLIGEGLLTTPHSKILRAQENSLSELEMANALSGLRAATGRGDADAARAILGKWVEGFGEVQAQRARMTPERLK